MMDVTQPVDQDPSARAAGGGIALGMTCLIVTILFFPATAEEKCPSAGISTAKERRLSGWMDQLGSDKIADRDEAERSILEWIRGSPRSWPDLHQRLLDRLRKEEDLEIRMKLDRIHRTTAGPEGIGTGSLRIEDAEGTPPCCWKGLKAEQKDGRLVLSGKGSVTILGAGILHLSSASPASVKLYGNDSASIVGQIMKEGDRWSLLHSWAGDLAPDERRVSDGPLYYREPETPEEKEERKMAVEAFPLNAELPIRLLRGGEIRIVSEGDAVKLTLEEEIDR